MSESKRVEFPCIRVTQPIGEFYIGSVSAKDLIQITRADVRRIEKDEEREIERYLGIQRPLSNPRVKELKEYVKTVDACFPTSIIIAVPEKCAKFDRKTNVMTLQAYRIEGDFGDEDENIEFEKIASILDGQHRLKGLEEYDGQFDLNVSIFIEADLEQQAMIFSTVNLAQTKVNKSLAYDLFDLAKSRSPQKTCHDIAVAFSEDSEGPFFKRIKRLGFAHEDSSLPTITQATFVEALMKNISRKPTKDRSDLIEGKTLARAEGKELNYTPLRNLFIDEKDLDIAEIISNYFESVKKKWPVAWESNAKGNMLNRTNGFKGLMKILPKLYLHIVEPGGIPKIRDYDKWFSKVNLDDSDLTTASYPPGQAGEAAFAKALMAQMGLK